MMRWVAVGTLVMALVFGTLLPASAASPTLTVSTPTDGQLIDGTSFTVTFSVTDFTIVPSTVPLAEAGKHPEVNRPGEGHIHLMLDLQPLVLWYQNAPYTFTNVPPGTHQLMVEVVNNDHSSLSPQVMRILTITTTGAGEVSPTTGHAATPSAAGSTVAVWLCLLVLGAGLLLRALGRRGARGANPG